MSLFEDLDISSSADLVDGSFPPVFTDQDKLHTILNVLRGYEEFTLNQSGIIISSNLEAVNITGYEEWEVIGKHISIFYTEEDIAINRYEHDLLTSVSEGKFSVDSWQLKKRQIRFWARIKIVPLYDSLQALRGYKVILRDATHKVYSDFKVQRIRNEYLNLYHNSVFGIIRFNQETGKLTLANKKALSILRMQDFQDLLFGAVFEHKVDFDNFCAQVKTKRYVNNFEFQLKRLSGETKWVSMDCKFYVATGFIEGIIIDVTKRKAQETSLLKLSNDLDTFIYHASHDLRAPLTSMMGLLNLIELNKDKGGSEQYTSLIRNRVMHLDQLLKDLSVIAFNSNSELSYEPIPLKEEIAYILQDFLAGHRIKGVLMVDDSIEFVSDVIRFRTILKNIISNSVKYHNQMDQSSFIKITVSTVNDRLMISVEDNGIGIEENQLEKIYNMFHRGHSSLSGSGLGLYIVRSMVDRLGGTVKLSSIIGKGTKVKLELPIRKS
jgi:PAS domain S-box-containing protein